MRKYIWTIILIIMLVLAAAPALISQEQAVIKDIIGQVTTLQPGGGWQAAAENTILSSGTTISTGFNSQAVLNLGSSVIVVKALTRMTLAELVRQGNTVKTSLHLSVGRVWATVKTAEGVTHDFKMRSTVSTASVRGTDFEYDGDTLTVFDGEVVFFNKFNQKRVIGGGETSRTTGYDMPTTGEEARRTSSTAVLYTNEVIEFEGGVASGPVVDTVDMVDVTLGVE